jgi:hypothetical protein
MSQDGKPSAPPPAVATQKPAAPAAVKPSAPSAPSPNLPTEHKYIEIKVGDFVEFKVRRPDGDAWKIGKVTSLNRDFTDIMPIDSERIYCTHKEFIKRVLSKDEASALPIPTNWYLERH